MVIIASEPEPVICRKQIPGVNPETSMNAVLSVNLKLPELTPCKFMSLTHKS